MPTGATNKTIKNEFGKRLFRFVGVDLKDRINRAGANQPRDERDKTDQPDPADAAGEEQNQAQQSDANDDANPAIHLSYILFHIQTLLSKRKMPVASFYFDAYKFKSLGWKFDEDVFSLNLHLISRRVANLHLEERDLRVAEIFARSDIKL